MSTERSHTLEVDALLVPAKVAAAVQTEEALLDCEEKYRVLLDEIKDYAIFMLNPQGMVARWNCSAERINEYKSEEIIGRNFSCFFSPEDIQRQRPEERKDGSKIPTEIMMSSLESSEDVLVTAAIRDISVCKDGREVLEEIKESLSLKTIPVVVLTNSASEADILQSYEHHANCHITKPLNLDGFLNVVNRIDSLSLSTVQLPRDARP